MQALATGVVERLLSQRIMQDFDGPSVIVQQTWHLTGLMPAETAWRGESEFREVVFGDFQPPFETVRSSILHP